MNTTIVERKIGSNRGRARVWLEGAWLADNGWARGVRFNVAMGAGRIVLERAPDGSRKVCGKANKHSIIDICNGDVASVLAPHGVALVKLTSARIVVTLKGGEAC